ncbi:MAG: AbrB/MazE/SpoVT family DNA-binding domain-containing protein [Sphingobium sp.]|nr:AbrB/MazE/SpoVT family DNA-binding domain-containing protein [Sphingobium sp.]
MNAMTVSSGGQITLRKELLEHLGAHPGDKIRLDKLPGGEVRIRAARPDGKIDGFFGCLSREGRRPILGEEVNEAIEQGWAGQP